MPDLRADRYVAPAVLSLSVKGDGGPRMSVIESALGIFVPEAEALVKPFRDRYDPPARSYIRSSLPMKSMKRCLTIFGDASQALHRLSSRSHRSGGSLMRVPAPSQNRCGQHRGGASLNATPCRRICDGPQRSVLTWSTEKSIRCLPAEKPVLSGAAPAGEPYGRRLHLPWRWAPHWAAQAPTRGKLAVRASLTHGRA
jgi:hypothetical protein